jgi:MFS family permease
VADELPDRRSLWSGRDLPSVVRRLGAVSFFQDVASEMVYPLLPTFLTLLGAGPATLGAMESAADAVVAFVKRWAGRASDRAGRRKPFVVFGYGGSALARPLLAVAAAPWQVLLLRVWDRFAKGVRTAPRDALLARAVEPGRRAYAFAFQRGLDHLGAAVGPLVAAALLAGGASLRLVFLAATLPAAAGFLVAWAGLPRESGAGAASPAGTATPAPAPERSSPAFRRALTAAFLFALGNASDAFLLLRARELGAPVPALALIWSAFHVVRSGASAPGGRIADRIGPRASLLLGWGLYAVCYGAFAWAATLPALLVAMVPYAAYAGLVEGAERALAVQLGGAGASAGSSLGSWHFAVGLGAALASSAFGVIYARLSGPDAFLAAAACAAAAVAVLATVRVPRTAQR